MKKNIILLGLIALLSTSCTQEPLALVSSKNGINLIAVSASTQLDDIPMHCVFKSRECDTNFLFPTKVPAPGYSIIQVTYNAALTIDEVFCVRYDYFTCFPNLKMSTAQPLHTHEDEWLRPIGRPGDDLANTTTTDPRIEL